MSSPALDEPPRTKQQALDDCLEKLRQMTYDDPRRAAMTRRLATLREELSKAAA